VAANSQRSTLTRFAMRPSFHHGTVVGPLLIVDL